MYLFRETSTIVKQGVVGAKYYIRGEDPGADPEGGSKGSGPPPPFFYNTNKKKLTNKKS